MDPGLSIEQMSESEMEDYVDFVLDACYTRVSFFFWRELYLYPGNMDVKTIGEARRAAIVQEYGLYTPDIRQYNENSHRKSRAFLQYARRRGLETYQMLTPAHAILDLLPGKPADWAGVGYYGETGGCWSKPEVREIARKACQLEMEYFAPMDGYTVWFYDPAGCFCAKCKPNQADMLVDQFKLVRDLGKRIFPSKQDPSRSGIRGTTESRARRFCTALGRVFFRAAPSSLTGWIPKTAATANRLRSRTKWITARCRIRISARR